MGAFDLELREARRVIREHHHNPSEFKLTRAPGKTPGGQLSFRDYTVTVARGNFPPATYEGGYGKNWVLLFAHDLGVHRFGEGVDRGRPTDEPLPPLF